MLALVTKRRSRRVAVVRREVIELSLYLFFFSFSPKSEPLRDKRETVGTEGKGERGMEDVLYGCSAMRKLECAGETLSTHTYSCITVRVCVGAAELYRAAGEVPQAIKSIFHELQSCSRLLSLALKSRT